MYSDEMREKAISSVLKYQSVDKAIEKLGYPAKKTLYNWICQEGLFLPSGKKSKVSKPTKRRKRKPKAIISEEARLLQPMQMEMAIVLEATFVAPKEMSAEQTIDAVRKLSKTQKARIVLNTRNRYHFKIMSLLTVIGLDYESYRYYRSKLLW